MVKIRKIVLYLVLVILTAQNSFFGFAYAVNDVACKQSAVNNSCDAYGMWYSYNQTKKCCVCTDTIKPDWSCASPGYWDNGDWCCVYACSVCSSPSLEFQKYVNFQVEMFQLLQNVVKEPEKKTDLKKVGLFSSRILTLPAKMWESWKRMFQKATKDFTQAGRAAQISAIMIATITAEIGTKDGLWWLAILTRNQPFVREWKTLQELDMTTHDLMWDFGTKWIWDDKISEDIRKDIEKLKQKYLMTSSNQNWLFEEFSFKWEVQYKDIIRILQKLNSVMKSFVSVHSWLSNNNFFRKYLSDLDSEMSRWNIIVKFNKILMDNMYSNYRCAEWMNACNNKLEEFKKAIRVLPDIKDSFSESMKTIKKANDELAKVFAGIDDKKAKNEKANNNSNLTDRQIELLRTVYGMDTSKLTQQQWFWISTLLNGTAFKNVANGINIKPLDIVSKNTIDSSKSAWKTWKQNRQDKLYLDSLAEKNTELLSGVVAKELADFNTWAVDLSELKTALSSTLNSVIDEKLDDKNTSLFYNNISTTRYFKETFSWIQKTIGEHIWKKDDDWLVKYLWETCKIQCGNKWSINCILN